MATLTAKTRALTKRGLFGALACIPFIGAAFAAKSPHNAIKPLALPLLNNDFEGPLEVAQVVMTGDECHPYLVDAKAGWIYPLYERYPLRERP